MDEPHVNYAGKAYPIPTSGFKLAEIDKVERYFDRSFDSLLSGQMMLASAWLAIHRALPEFTLEEASELEIDSLAGSEEEQETSSPPEDSDPVGEGNGSGIPVSTGALHTVITSGSE